MASTDCSSYPARDLPVDANPRCAFEVRRDACGWPLARPKGIRQSVDSMFHGWRLADGQLPDSQRKAPCQKNLLSLVYTSNHTSRRIARIWPAQCKGMPKQLPTNMDDVQLAVRVQEQEKMHGNKPQKSMSMSVLFD